jgi:hypothetical protein
MSQGRYTKIQVRRPYPLTVLADHRIATYATVEHDDQLCKGKPFPRGLMDKVALAITWNPRLDNGDYLSTQTQLCPWFVEWIKERKYKLQKDAMMTTNGKTLIKLSGKLPFSFSQIGTHEYNRNEQSLTSSLRYFQLARQGSTA